MNGLDLFSGIGGITKALELWVTPVAYCEHDRYAISVLLSRMSSGDLPVAPIWDDVQTLHGGLLPPIDIIYGGFPCQDISLAGCGAGLDGKRSGLFFEIARLVGEIRPRFVFLENVPAIRTRGADVVTEEMARLGYDCRWDVISAADVGANHRRKRWWLLAYAMAHASGGRRRQKYSHAGRSSQGTIATQERGRSSNGGWWETEPNVGRVAHGVPLRVDRLRGLGNAVVPAQAREAFERLMGFK